MAEILNPGDKAPAFTLQRENGEKISLQSLRGSKVVLYFYPRAGTPGCTQEAIAFNGKRRDFTKANTVILGVSADPLKAQEKFRDKYEIAFALLSDETHKMLSAYGVGQKEPLRQNLPRRETDHVSDRRERRHRPGVAKSESRSPRRRGACRSTCHLNQSLEPV